MWTGSWLEGRYLDRGIGLGSASCGSQVGHVTSERLSQVMVLPAPQVCQLLLQPKQLCQGLTISTGLRPGAQ